MPAIYYFMASTVKTISYTYWAKLINVYHLLMKKLPSTHGPQWCKDIWKYGILKVTSHDFVQVGLRWGPEISVFKKHPQVFLMCSQDYDPSRKKYQFDMTWEKKSLQT